MPPSALDRLLLTPTSTSKTAFKDESALRALAKTPILSSTHTASIQQIVVETYARRLQKHSGSIPPPEQLLASRILDAPNLEDDYYLNLLDWSLANNHVAVGLQAELFIWNAATGKSQAVARLAGDDRITAVGWGREDLLAIGTKTGRFELIDVERKTRVIATKSHGARIAVLGWDAVSGKLSSGGRDRVITHYDPRTPKVVIGRVCQAHEQEVCGLRWDPHGGKLASGGNDNQLLIWDPSKLSEPLLRCNEHVAAVKAIAWSPHQSGLLASGGGTADRSIKFWNVRGVGTPDSSIQSVLTASQVCNMVWSPHAPQLVTSHGFSEHQCLRWKYPEMQVTGVMRGHEQRVLYLALSPDGSTVVTGSADETIRFWPVFSTSPQRPSANGRARRLLQVEDFINIR